VAANFRLALSCPLGLVSFNSFRLVSLHANGRQDSESKYIGIYDIYEGTPCGFAVTALTWLAPAAKWVKVAVSQAAKPLGINFNQIAKPSGSKAKNR